MADTLSALLQEGRTFPPPPKFAKDALITDAGVYDDAERDWEGFWATQALALDWHREWDAILEWELPFAKWFVGGKLNVSENCLDRHGDVVALKDIADEALADTPSIEHVVVLRRTESPCAMQDGRDVWWHDAVGRQSPQCAAESMDAEDLLFILYTSGTTGKPKGIM